MASNLTRDVNGRILSNNSPIILHGGHYYLFKDGDNPGRGLFKPNEPVPFAVQYTGVPCQTETFTVQEMLWQPEPWTILFDHLNNMKCNLLRVWLTGGTLVSGTGGEPKPLDLTPFHLSNVNGHWKWDVYDAVINHNWNAEFFRRLAKFAEIAEGRGVNLQISLFNYLDLTRRFDGGDFRAWCRSFWNPALCNNPPSLPNWGTNHLVNAGQSFLCTDAPNNEYENARQSFFLVPTNGLRQVQQALVTKTVQSLTGRTNIIYEVMNEPRGTHEQATAFSSTVVGWILRAAGAQRPLISINASNYYADVAGQPPTFDIDWWRDHPAYANYDKVDAISYHGLTGYPASVQTVCNKGNQQVPPVDPGAIKTRFDTHTNKTSGKGHPTKSLIYSTDAARVGALLHTYKDQTGTITYELHVRDGQIYTNYPNSNQDPWQTQRIRSDLQNWAYWCFSLAVKNPGVVHFQNHSMDQRAYRRLMDALNQASTSPMILAAAEQVETV
jgi:hypothetical protein